MQTMKRLPLIMSILAVLAFAVNLAGIRAQEEKKQPACENQIKTFLLAPSDVEAKVKELSKKGYCISKTNFLPVGDKVLLITDNNDLTVQEPPEEQ